jgi:hypothetical protein
MYSTLGRGLVAALSLALISTAALARDVHVDVAIGSDATGDGTPLAPFKTIGRALADGLVSGDHVRIAAGVHDPAAGESFPLIVAEGVSLDGEPGATVLGPGTAAAALRATTSGSTRAPPPTRSSPTCSGRTSGAARGRSRTTSSPTPASPARAAPTTTWRPARRRSTRARSWPSLGPTTTASRARRTATTTAPRRPTSAPTSTSPRAARR